MLPFITAFDPLGSSNGSIDPLGALQSYGALADLLLPGISTITTRSRYLSMLCRAIKNVDEYCELPPGPSGLAVRRRSVEPFERLWAAACVAAREEGIKNATEGLRGVTYAERAMRDFREHDRKITPDFKLLKYQSRTGAVGTYWSAMVGAGLVDPNTGAVTVEGQTLAELFPLPPSLSSGELKRLADPDQARRVSVSLDDLVSWAKKCHLAAATREERRCLSEALTSNGRREAVATAIRLMAVDKSPPNEWNISTLRKLRKQLNELEVARALELPAVIDAVILAEQFHEAVLSIFETLLWWATQPGLKHVDGLTSDEEFIAASDRARNAAEQLLSFYRNSDVPRVRTALDSLRSFAMNVETSEAPRQMLDCILARHHTVQSGKLDGGAPKRDWISWQREGQLLRPSPRFQKNDRPSLPRGARLTHPYRLEQFIFMLQENDFLPAA